MECSIEVQKDLFYCYIDYSKAFDQVQHEKLFDILGKLDIDGKHSSGYVTSSGSKLPQY